MADLGEIVEELRTVDGNDSGQEIDKDSVRRKSSKRKRSRNRRNSGGSQGPVQPFPSGGVPEGGREENENRKQNVRQPADAEKRHVLPAQEGLKTRFYEDYRKVAEEYDKEFLKKYAEDLDTTLIFAGLFSAVASAFIIQVDSQLRPDSGDETAALLRVLIYKIDNTTFGNNVPTLPQWNGPPHAMVHVQAILFASLAASLLSAFLAMLGKQWLNRYASTDMRGSAIQRGQNRQRKLDGIVAWYFDSMMEGLPLMLQIALLLLGSALTRYLWETSITVALVVLVVTAFGLFFYFCIVLAGTAWESCPYQTPGSRFFRFLGPKVRGIFHLATRNILKESVVVDLLADVWDGPFRASWADLMRVLTALFLGTPVMFAIDLYHLGRAAVKALAALPAGAYHLLRRAGTWLHGVYSSFSRGLEQRMAALDLRCISWTLQTSLEKPVHLSTLEHLVATTEFIDLDPTLITACFDIFIGCTSFRYGRVVVVQGLEQLVTVSAKCFFKTSLHLSATRPTSTVLADLRRRYRRIFPFDADFRGLPFYHTMTRIHALAHRRWNPRFVKWTDYTPSSQELIQFSRHMVDATQAEYQPTENKRVPRWILRFALHSLSLSPPSPASVIADCLTIIAIALDHDVSSVLVSDESVRVEHVGNLITQELELMAEVPGTGPIFRSRRKAISALFPYAVRLAQDGQWRMLDIILRVASNSTSGFMWRCIGPYITTLFDKSTPSSLNQAITFASPCADWIGGPYTERAVTRWAAAVSETPYSVEVGQSVVDALLQIAYNDSLRPYIPIDIWGWLKRRPSLPPVCRGRYLGMTPGVVQHIRRLRDAGILKSYFLLVWSEWDIPDHHELPEMGTAIKVFNGTGMHRHRGDLLKRLNHVLRELNQGVEHLKQLKPQMDEDHIRNGKRRYKWLRRTLAGEGFEGGAIEDTDLFD